MKRNPKRVDEMWDLTRVKAVDAEIKMFPSYIVLSGGWAWHYISPKHEERKILHDHKDIDMFVPPEKFQELATFLKNHDYQRIWTKYDKHSTEFYRYEKRVGSDEQSVKILIDVFLKEVPFITMGIRKVVEPKTLLSFYGEVHTTDDCVAVIAAKQLLARHVNPVLRNELVE